MLARMRGLGSERLQSKAPVSIPLSRGKVDLLVNLLPVAEGNGTNLFRAWAGGRGVRPVLRRPGRRSHPRTEQQNQKEGDRTHGSGRGEFRIERLR